KLAATYTDAFSQTDSKGNVTPPNPIHIDPGQSSTSATQYLVRPPVDGLVSGQSYKLKLTDSKNHLYQFENLSDSSVVNIGSSVMSGTHSLFKDGIALGSTTDTATQSLYLVLSGTSGQGSPGKLLNTTGTSLRLISSPSGATGQSTVSTDNGSGAVFNLGIP